MQPPVIVVCINFIVTNRNKRLPRPRRPHAMLLCSHGPNSMRRRKEDCLHTRTGCYEMPLNCMRYTVKCMYRNGIRLTCSQIEEAVAHIGVVVVEEMPSGPFRPPARKARLLTRTNAKLHSDTIQPLFDAEILGLDRGHTMIHGYQIHIDMATGAVRQDAQCWLVSAFPDC